MLTFTIHLLSNRNNYLYKTPGAPLRYFDWRGGGEVWQRFIFHTQKYPNVRLSIQKHWSLLFFSIPKKSHTSSKLHLSILLIWAVEKYNPKKSLFFFMTQKILVSFLDPKKSLLAKISDPQKSLRSPISKICEWGPWVQNCYNLMNALTMVIGFLKFIL